MNSIDHYFLRPGYIFIPDQHQSISAVIGSGVSVCIYDRENRIGGMNLFLFPQAENKKNATAMYGDAATAALIRMMIDSGSRKEHLESQIFGGAFNPDRMDTDIGETNIEVARKILTKYHIPVSSEDIGGKKGRKVVFNTGINEVAVLKVDSLRDEDWFPYE